MSLSSLAMCNMVEPCLGAPQFSIRAPLQQPSADWQSRNGAPLRRHRAQEHGLIYISPAVWKISLANVCVLLERTQAKACCCKDCSNSGVSDSI